MRMPVKAVPRGKLNGVTMSGKPYRKALGKYSIR